MKTIVCNLAAITFILTGMNTVFGGEGVVRLNDESFSGLLSVKMEVRRDALTQLKGRYLSVHESLERALAEALKKHKEDDRYMSPLHTAILAVGAWRDFESEDMLISIVNYELDAGSLPQGIEVSGDFFFPAVRALVDLRVNPRKLVNAIAQTSDSRRQQLLICVLRSRVSSTDDAATLLKTGGANANTQKALEWLNQAENAADLLPQPKQSKKSSAGSQTNASPADAQK